MNSLFCILGKKSKNYITNKHFDSESETVRFSSMGIPYVEVNINFIRVFFIMLSW